MAYSNLFIEWTSCWVRAVYFSPMDQELAGEPSKGEIYDELL